MNIPLLTVPPVLHARLLGELVLHKVWYPRIMEHPVSTTHFAGLNTMDQGS